MQKKFLILIFAAILSAAGCIPGKDNQIKEDNAVKPIPISVVKLKIKPYNVKITAGYTVKFAVEGIKASGKRVVLSTDWKLTGGAVDTGTLNDKTGNEVVFTARVPGKITIEAEYNNLKASAAIEVVKKM